MCKLTFSLCLVLPLLLLCRRIDAQQRYDCEDDQFQCDNGECININQKCNSVVDCEDGSDETFINCHDMDCPGYRCSYGACLDSSKWCDGIKDCIDGRDEYEFDCSANEDYYNKILLGNCTHKDYVQFQCTHSKECLPHSKLCNGIEDCRDKSDESLDLCVGSICPVGAFRCAYGACITGSAACDHVLDCRDGSDEIPEICKKKYPNEEWVMPSRPIKAVTTAPTVQNTVPPIHHKPSSEEKDCIVTDPTVRLRTIYNGLPYLGNGTVWHQVTVRLSCAPRHVLQGNDVNTCYNGEWKDEWPECVKECARNVIINNPRLHVDCSSKTDVIDCFTANLVPSTRATITCAQGYKSANGVSHIERICESNGIWKNRNKKARAIRCVPDCGRTFPTVRGFPWVVSIFQRTSNDLYEFRCLGTIIDPFYVLTVASCFSSDSSTDYTTVLGNQTVAFNVKQEHGYEIRNLAYIDLHEISPLALLRMINPFILSAKVRPICLKALQEYDDPPLGNKLGEPLAQLQDDRTYSLSHIADRNKMLNIKQYIDAIKDELTQNNIKM